MAFCEEIMEEPKIVFNCRWCGERVVEDVRMYSKNPSNPPQKFEVKEGLADYFSVGHPLLKVHNCASGDLGILEPFGVTFPEPEPNLKIDNKVMMYEDGKISIVDHEIMIRRVRNGNARFILDLLSVADEVNEFPVKKLVFLKRNLRRFIEDQKRVDLISDAIEGDPGEDGEEEAFEEYKKSKKSLLDVIKETKSRFVDGRIDVAKVEVAILRLRKRAAVLVEGYDRDEWDALEELLIPSKTEEKDDNSN